MEIKDSNIIDTILETTNTTKNNKKGYLKIFFSYAAGVGKTYAMLDEAQELFKNGMDVVIGCLGTHTKETKQLLYGLPTLHSKVIEYNNLKFNEFDLDAALNKKPELILIDDLAHTNAYGVRNKRRYQDIEELINAGINVYTTVNVEHIESLKDVIQGITNINVVETIPDSIFDNADKVEFVDIEPDELLNRLKMGKVLSSISPNSEMYNYFAKENLRILREIAIRKVADRISHDNQNEPKLLEKMASTKILVCIGSSPTSEKCIRWAARTAEAFHSPWVAVYIENEDGLYLHEKNKKTIQSNMELVEQLGGEVVTLNGYDIASTVAEYAKRTGITNIVIGKSRNKKTFKNIFEMDLEDKLLSLLTNVEIHIIPNNNISNSYRKPSKLVIHYNSTFSWRELSITLGMLIVATTFSSLLKVFDLDKEIMIMVYILSVLAVSMLTTGYIYGAISSILSVLLFNYFITKPYYSFTTIEKSDTLTFFIMLMVSLIASTLTVRAKAQANYAVDKERRTELLYEINKKLLVTTGLINIVNLTNEYITKIFKRSTIFYIKDPVDGSAGILLQSDEEMDATFLLNESEKEVAHWVFVNQKRAGAGTDTLMNAGGFYMPVISQGNVLGVIGLSCTKGNINQNKRSFLRMIASQVAMALERQRLSDTQKSIQIESEKEKMKSNLLRAISHDLRTPLTGIIGASSTILENNDTLDNPTKIKLISNIKEEAQWLIRMVENLLSVTRINDESSEVKKTPEAAEEIVAAAISRIRKRFKEQKINVKVPEEFLLVPMDGTLIEQVLINLIENAIKHSGETVIDVELKKEGSYAIFEVSDNGEGITEQDFPNLFESYIPNGKKTSDSSRGMGIGLSICMSIINAHHGKMEAENKTEGGAVFRFTLPLE